MKKYLSLLLLILFVGCVTFSSAFDHNAAAEWAESCAYGCAECPDDQSCGNHMSCIISLSLCVHNCVYVYAYMCMYLRVYTNMCVHMHLFIDG